MLFDSRPRRVPGRSFKRSFRYRRLYRPQRYLSPTEIQQTLNDLLVTSANISLWMVEIVTYLIPGGKIGDVLRAVSLPSLSIEARVRKSKDVCYLRPLLQLPTTLGSYLR